MNNQQYDSIAYYRMRITPDASELVDVSAQHLHGQIVLGAAEILSLYEASR